MARSGRKLSDQVRKAIESCGESRYRISKETGIPQETLSRFMHGTGGLSTSVLDRLAEYLRLDVTVRPKRRR